MNYVSDDESDMNGGTTLKYYTYLKHQKPLFEDREIPTAELIGLEPIYSLYINSRIPKVYDYLKMIETRYPIVQPIIELMDILFHDPTRETINQRNDLLTFLVESGQYVNFCLGAFQLFVKHRQTVENKADKEKLVRHMKICIQVCKDIKHTPEQINQMIKDTNSDLQFLYQNAEKSIADKLNIFENMVRNGMSYLTKSERKALLKILCPTHYLRHATQVTPVPKIIFEIDKLIANIDKIMKTRLSPDDMINFSKDLKESVNGNPDILITFIETEIEQLKLKEDISDKHNTTINLFTNLQTSIQYEYEEFRKIRLEKFETINAKINNYITRYMKMYKTQLKYCKKFGCDKFCLDKKHKVFKVPFDKLEKNIEPLINVIIHGFEATQKHTYCSPILIFGLLLSFYYRYLEVFETDDEIEKYYDLVRKSLFEYNQDTTKLFLDSKVTTAHTSNFTKWTELYKNHMDSYATFDESWIELYSDIVHASFNVNGDIVQHTACGEVTLLNIMRLLETIDIYPKNEKYRKILNIDDSTNQVNEIAYITANLPEFKYSKTHNGFEYNLIPNQSQMVWLLNEIYFENKTEYDNVIDFFTAFDISIIQTHDNRFKIKIKENELEVQLAMNHARISYISPINIPVIFTFMDMCLINHQIDLNRTIETYHMLSNIYIFLNRQDDVILFIRDMDSKCEIAFSMLLDVIENNPSIPKKLDPVSLMCTVLKCRDIDIAIRTLKYIGNYVNEENSINPMIPFIYMNTLEFTNVELIELIYKYLLHYPLKYNKSEYSSLIFETGIKMINRIEDRDDYQRVLNLTIEIIEKLNITQYGRDLMIYAYKSNNMQLFDYVLDFMLRSPTILHLDSYSYAIDIVEKLIYNKTYDNTVRIRKILKLLVLTNEQIYISFLVKKIVELDDRMSTVLAIIIQLIDYDVEYIYLLNDEKLTDVFLECLQYVRDDVLIEVVKLVFHARTINDTIKQKIREFYPDHYIM